MIGVTMGDGCGIGPEILLKAYREKKLGKDVVVFGELSALRFYNSLLGAGVALRSVKRPGEACLGAMRVLDLAMLPESDITPGQVNAAAGRAAREAVVRATQAALCGQIAAVVTLPINKQAVQRADPSFTGHTELIGQLCGARDVTIMLVSGSFMVTHVSTHCSLREAIRRVRPRRVRRIIELTCEAANRILPGARVAVAGLNPHAGEAGAFGDEEIRVIRPAVDWAREKGWNVEGPLAPDTVFHLAVRRRLFDAVVCMYHDQGHVPLKLLDFDGGVNVTLGVPVIRTSVDHGTAFDIAGQGIASIRSFLAALDLARRLAKKQAAAKPDRPRSCFGV